MASGIFPLLNVSNLEKTVEWYRSLGLKAKIGQEGPMRWGEVTSGNGVLILIWKDMPVENQPADTREWLSGELGKGVIVNVGVANIQKHWALAQAARVDVDMPLTQMPYGGSEFWAVDPDGYVVCLADKFPGETKPARKAKAKPKARAAKAKRAAGTRKAPAKGKGARNARRRK